MKKPVFAFNWAFVLFTIGCAHPPAHAAPAQAGSPVSPKVHSAGATAQQTFFTLTTGNGHGFELFDAQSMRLFAFLDHPYRYTMAPVDIRNNGIERRNLLEELSLGLSENEQTTWLDSVNAVPFAKAQVSYLEETNIVHAVTALKGSTSDARTVESYYYAPFGLEKNALIAMMHTPPEHSEATMRLRFHLGANPISPNFWDGTLAIVKIPGETIARMQTSQPAWVIRGQGAGAVVYIPLQGHTRAKCDIISGPGVAPTVDQLGDAKCSASELGFSLSAPLDGTGYFGVLVAYIENANQVEQETQQIIDWIAKRSSSKLLHDSLSEWAQWRKTPPAAQSTDELRLWRQSEAVLRMAQMREPNLQSESQKRTSHGMILASLAPGAWATGWVRDGSYATVALARSGHFAEAKSSLNFFLNAEPVGKFKNYVGNFDYRISVTRYFGSGEEEGDYSNEDTPNVETDGWGLVLWAARQYIDQSHDRAWLDQATRQGSVYEALKGGVAEAIASQLENAGRGSEKIMKPDSSIWEVHQQNAKHFAFTSLTAARGLCDFAAIAKRSGHGEDHDRFKKLAAEVRGGFLDSFAKANGYLIGALERSGVTDLDTAVAEAYGFDIFSDFGSAVARKTVEHLEALRLPSGGFSRVAGTTSYEIYEWPFVDFRMASVYLRMNQLQASRALIQRIVEQSVANNHLIPEMYAPTALQDYQGSNPMVGYGSGAYLLAILDREGHFENHDCD